jgi:hypothetical protein
MNTADFAALKVPLVVLVAAAALGAAAIYYTDRALDTSRSNLGRQHKQLQEARTKVQRSDDEKQLIVRYIGDYRRLEKMGFVGEEQRINWLDGLRIANQQAQLFGVNYQVSAQHAYPYANELDPGQLVMRESLMRVNFRLLHEGDLMRFLETLAKQGVGVFSVNQCTLSRTGAGGPIRFQANLGAECELAWITVSPPPGERK